MRSYVPAYELQAPRDLSDVLERMTREPAVWKPFAGGTDLMVLLEAGKLPHRRFLSIWKLAELRGIEETPAYVTLGALTTYADLRLSEILAREFPLLCRAAAETGSVATQNRGTLGGNIANASPAADSPPALLVYDAALELVSAGGSRWVPYHGFWTGYKQTGLRADELICRIRVPRATQGWRQYYPQSRNASCASHIKSMFCGRCANRCRADCGCPHKLSAASRQRFCAPSKRKKRCAVRS